jgi:mannose-6-phosphate isomerase-like protein (cupin superfamily)
MKPDDVKGRVFLRGIVSDDYALEEHHRRRLEAPRVRDGRPEQVGAPSDSPRHSPYSHVKWRLAPGDEPFLTQNIQMHFVRVGPGKANRGHGHQNEAAFYILQGTGHEIHDGLRYDWTAGDVVVVHTDSVHQHFNDGDEDMVALVVKAKASWIALGLTHQGISEPFEREGFSEPQDWSVVWTPGVEQLGKVVRPTDRTWTFTPEGWIRDRISAATPEVRLFSLDLWEHYIHPDSTSGRVWRMADEVHFVLSGSGTVLHWEVAPDIAERYRARIALEPRETSFSSFDTLYTPQNTVRQFRNDGDEPLVILSVRNRLIAHLGYDAMHVIEPAPGGGDQPDFLV